MPDKYRQQIGAVSKEKKDTLEEQFYEEEIPRLMSPPMTDPGIFVKKVQAVLNAEPEGASPEKL